MRNTSLIILILALALPAISFCNFTIITPPQLKFEYRSKNLQYSIANFGYVPYGRTLLAPVILAKPNEKACEPIESPDPQKIHEAPFVLIERGDCTFVTKVRHAQYIGARMVIIIDNRDEHTSDMVMADDGHASDIKIPAVFISVKDGATLKQYVKDGEGSEGNNVVLSIKFDNIQRSVVDYTFWLTSGYRQSFALVKEYKPYHESLGKYANMSIHYSVSNFQKLISLTGLYQEDCVCQGQYCAVDPDGDSGPGTGRDIIEEDLREICIFQQDEKHWWNYMENFDNDCPSPASFKECSKKVQKKLDIDTDKIDACVQKSYTAVDHYEAQNNSILADERKANLQNGVLFWPSVQINGQFYRGNLDGDEVFEAICADFTDPPSACDQILKIKRSSDEGSSVNVTTIIIVVIVVLIVFFAFMVFVYKRMVRRELQKEMSTQVNQMVSQYIAFYETRDKSRNTENA